jgi:hypothetical protein
VGIDTGRWWDCESVAQTPGAGKREGALGARPPTRIMSPARSPRIWPYAARNPAASALHRPEGRPSFHNFRQMLRIFRLATCPPAAGLPARVRRRFPKIRLPPRRSRSAMASTTSALRCCSQAMRRSGVLTVAGSRLRKDARLSPERPSAASVGIRVADSSVSATKFHTPVARPPSLCCPRTWIGNADPRQSHPVAGG